MRHLLTILLLSCWAAAAGQLTLAWDPSPDSWATGYRIYAGTNSVNVHGLTNAVLKVDAGTNLTCQISNLTAGLWFFVATAYTTNGIESLPSNEVVAQIAKPPENMRTIIAEWSGDVASTNWQTVGFLRMRFGP